MPSISSDSRTKSLAKRLLEVNSSSGNGITWINNLPCGQSPSTIYLWIHTLTNFHIKVFGSRIFVNNLNITFWCKIMHYITLTANTAAFTVTVVTNRSVLFVTILVPTEFSLNTSLTVHIRMVKPTARTSLTEALIV